MRICQEPKVMLCCSNPSWITFCCGREEVLGCIVYFNMYRRTNFTFSAVESQGIPLEQLSIFTTWPWQTLKSFLSCSFFLLVTNQLWQCNVHFFLNSNLTHWQMMCWSVLFTWLISSQNVMRDWCFSENITISQRSKVTREPKSLFCKCQQIIKLSRRQAQTIQVWCENLFGWCMKQKHKF